MNSYKDNPASGLSEQQKAVLRYLDDQGGKVAQGHNNPEHPNSKYSWGYTEDMGTWRTRKRLRERGLVEFFTIVDYDSSRLTYEELVEADKTKDFSLAQVSIVTLAGLRASYVQLTAAGRIAVAHIKTVDSGQMELPLP